MTAQTTTNDADIGLLGLGNVLVGSLPATLLTDDAPATYTVEAVFTRRPDPDEIDQILAADTRDYLERRGYPAVQVHVSDRRLEIAGTSLEQLRDGLGAVLAERLADISTGIRSRRESAALRFQEASDREQDRAAAVASLAESVSFARPAPTTAADRAVTPPLTESDHEAGAVR